MPGDRRGAAAPADYFVGGRALIARLLAATLRHPRASAQLNTALTELVVTDGVVTGAVVEQDGRRRGIRATRGVLLAAGGRYAEMWRLQASAEQKAAAPA